MRYFNVNAFTQTVDFKKLKKLHMEGDVYEIYVIIK